MQQQSSFIDPHRLYSLRGFYTESGISETRRREAARAGVELETLVVGRLKYVRGRDGIAYIEKLAAMENSQHDTSCELTSQQSK
jgi:hypothetical protein